MREMKNWIENLKVGDYVFVSWRMGTSLRKVEAITPKGNIKVNGMIFNKNGSERGGVQNINGKPRVLVVSWSHTACKLFEKGGEER